MYLFLIERARLVRDTSIPRKRDKIHLLNIGALSLWAVVVGLGIHFRLSHLGDDGQCYIGTRPGSPVTWLTLSYDFFFNVLFPPLRISLRFEICLTLQFLLPLVGLYAYQHAINTRLRRVARNTLSKSLIFSCAHDESEP
jgi:hypothetical protein